MKWHGELTEMREWIKSVKRFLDSHSFGVAVVAALVVFALGAGFTAWKWDSLHGSSAETNVSTTLRNMGLLIAGGLAIVFAAWRGWVAERQSATARQQAAIAQEQSDIAQQGLLYDRYQRGAQMLGNEILAVRMAGIYALQRLAEEHPENYHIQIMQTLCSFVRNPVGDIEPESLRSERIVSSEQATREDVRAIMMALKDRSEKGQKLELDADLCLDLRGANLVGCDLAGMNLSRATLGGVNFALADLTDAILSSADLRRAVLSKSKLGSADFSSAILYKADFSEASAQQADFSGAVITESNFSRTDLSGAKLGFSWIRDTKMSGAVLENADFTRTNVPTPEDELEAYSRRCGITQQQLDEIRWESWAPPEFHGLLDAESLQPLALNNQLPAD